jgi:hypothetical protein
MHWKIFSLILLLTTIYSHQVLAAPRLAFSDLINGPVQGLSDGLGQGAIVTVWGYNLGDTPGKVFFEDSNGQQKQAAHVYYWKKADGKLPGGPANLYKSHQLYEVAFSLPTTTLGLGKIVMQDSAGTPSNTLPFTAISGRIFHIKANGSNTNDGSFNRPWLFMNADDYNIQSPGNGMLKAGDIVYFHGTKEILDYKKNPNLRAAIFVRSLAGTENAHIGFVSYPNTVATVESPTWGIHPYVSTGIITSKFGIYGGMLNEQTGKTVATFASGMSTTQIETSANGRIIGNLLADMPEHCSNGMSGAVSGTGTSTDNVSILGNEIADIGCQFTSHFHHTTYISRRTQTGATPNRPGVFAWNYLHDNKAKYGIHYYDQSNDSSKSCDHISGTLNIHNNYIINQRSLAISVHTASNRTCWELDTNIYQNILVNVGLGPIAELANGVQPYAMYLGGAIAGKFRVFNNLIYKVSDADGRRFETPFAIYYNRFNDLSSLSIVNNIIQPEYPMEVMGNENDVEIRNNLIKLPIQEPTLFKKIFSQKINVNERLNYFEGPQLIFGEPIKLGGDSNGIARGLLDPATTHDFYGRTINPKSPTIGPVQYAADAE